MAPVELLANPESIGEKRSNTPSPAATKQVCVVPINLPLIRLMGTIVYPHGNSTPQFVVYQK